MRKLIWILFLAFWAAPIWAATNRYVSPSGSGGTCSSGTPCSVSTALGATVAGDTVTFKTGTYSIVLGGTGIGIPGGSSNSARVTLVKDSGATVTIQPTVGQADRCITLSGASKSYITIDGLDCDATNVPSGYDAIKTDYPSNPADVPHDVTFQNIEITNAPHNGIEIQAENQIVNILISHLNVHNPAPKTKCQTEPYCHGFYVHSGGVTVEYSRFSGFNGMGGQIYSSVSGANNNIIRYNILDGNAVVGNVAGMAVGAGTGLRIYGNIISNNFGADAVQIGYGQDGAVFYNNTVYNNHGSCVNNLGGSTTVKNNLCVSNPTNGVTVTGGSVTQSNNVASNSPASFFVNAAGGNFSLIAGASTAIDQGTSSIATGITACANGSAPDIGAIETIGTPTATVNGADAVITVPNNCTTQMLPASTVTGWTFKKNGSGDTVTANSRSGTNSFAATLTSAFVGGDTCLFSYSQSGNTTSDNNIGNLTTNNQEVLAFTDTACTNLTAGGGATLAYTHGRWYLLQGSTDTAWTPKAAADTNVTVAPGSKLNLRWKVKNTGGDTSLNPRIRVAYDGGSYVELTSSYVNAVKALGSGVQLGTVMTDGSPMTQDQLTSDVANIACTYIRNPVSAPNLALTTNTESECGAAIDFDTTAVAGKQYDFKLYDDVGTAVSGGPISVIIGGYSSVR